MFYIFFVVLNVKRSLRAKSVTQCPRVSYRDRDVLYGELNCYPGCPPPEFHLYP